MIELRHVAATPSASTDTCAPLPVRSIIAAIGSVFFALITCAAPMPLASSSLAESRSTPITLAPIADALLIADSPIPPHPCTTTHSPGFTCARSTTPSNELVKQHPIYPAATHARLAP